MKRYPAWVGHIRWGMWLAFAYFVAGKLGLLLALPPVETAGVFPAAGIGVAAVYLWGRSAVPWIALGALVLAWGHAGPGTGGALAAALLTSAAVLEALIGGRLLRQVLGTNAALDEGRQIGRYLLIAPLAALVGATLSVIALVALGLAGGDGVREQWATRWIADALGVVVFFPLVLAFCGKPAAAWRRRRLLVVSTTVLCLALAVLAYQRSSATELDRQKQAFNYEAGRIAVRLQERFDEQAYLLEQLETYFSKASTHVSRVEFKAYVQPALGRFPMLQAIEWIPHVHLTRRAGFEQEQRATMPEFEIRERSDAGKMIAAAQRPAYFPVTYVEPLPGNEKAVGFDLFSNPARAAAISQALASGKPVATEPIKLVQEKGSQMGTLLLQRVNTPAQDLVLTVIRIGDFVSAFVPRDALVELALADVRSGEMLHGGLAAPRGPIEYSQKIEFGGREYQLRITPTAKYTRSNASLQSWAVLVAGTLGAGLFGALMLLTTGMTYREEILVDERTAEISAIYKLCPDGLVCCDQRREIRFANPAFLSMLGLSAEQVIGRPLAELEGHIRRRGGNAEHWSGFESCSEPLYDAGGGARRNTLELQKPNPRVLQIQGVSGDSAAIGHLFYVRDITHETEVDRMKSEFLTHAAHELRTPMTTIYGFSELVLSRNVDSKTLREILTSIHKQTAWLIEIINELLDLSRIDARRGEDFNIEKISAAEVVDEVLEAMKLDAARWPLLVDIPAALPQVMGDRSKLRAVFVNVLSNAVKYSPRGGSIRIHGLSEEGGATPTVSIAVSDQGIGMTPEHAARVGERFFRADNSGNIPGSGLGMAIVKETLKVLGGRLAVHSQVGAGTTVTLWLPAASG
ncbi:CHASE domain-containing protein [Roseateles saccharophilus]|uniref:histidine kinase n=1 Tax=Roseateles saccharophilus TaxID=304 RepID=A0A4R3UKT5_ROSSA|nr:CHASE domain-containing protein [Roseateles saccharophilus]TCU90963.1 PAS domain S-box-containing protein [Roseateles saccharophilus]